MANPIKNHSKLYIFLYLRWWFKGFRAQFQSCSKLCSGGYRITLIWMNTTALISNLWNVKFYKLNTFTNRVFLHLAGDMIFLWGAKMYNDAISNKAKCTLYFQLNSKVMFRWLKNLCKLVKRFVLFFRSNTCIIVKKLL